MRALAAFELPASVGRCCFCFAVVSARLLLLSLSLPRVSCLVVAAVALGLPSLPPSLSDADAAGEALRRWPAAVPSVLRRRGEETADCRSAVAASLLADVVPPSHVSGSSRSLVVERRGRGHGAGARIRNFAS